MGIAVGMGILSLLALIGLHEFGCSARTPVYYVSDVGTVYHAEVAEMLTPQRFGGVILAMEQLGHYANDQQSARFKNDRVGLHEAYPLQPLRQAMLDAKFAFKKRIPEGCICCAVTITSADVNQKVILEQSEGCQPDLLSQYEWGMDDLGISYKLISYNSSVPADVMIGALTNMVKGATKTLKLFNSGRDSKKAEL